MGESFVFSCQVLVALCDLVTVQKSFQIKIQALVLYARDSPLFSLGLFETHTILLRIFPKLFKLYHVCVLLSNHDCESTISKWSFDAKDAVS